MVIMICFQVESQLFCTVLNSADEYGLIPTLP